MSFGTLINKIHIRLLPHASPHYYHGRSSSKLFLNNFLLFLFRFILVKPPSKVLINPTRKLKDSKLGKTALVLGNGPSIDSIDIAALPIYVDDIYCVNEFYKLEISKELKCNNYVLSDPLSFTDKDFALPDNFVDQLNQNDARLFAPHWSAKAFPNLFLNSKLFYFDDRERTWFNRKISPTKPRNYTSVTLYKALAIACYQGYSTIYVLGMDNTEFISYEGSHNNTIYHNLNTYGIQSSSTPPISMQEVFHSGMAGRMQSYSHLFGDLKKFRKYNIVNLDQKSLTDIFPKIETGHELSVKRLSALRSQKERRN